MGYTYLDEFTTFLLKVKKMTTRLSADNKLTLSFVILYFNKIIDAFEAVCSKLYFTYVIYTDVLFLYSHRVRSPRTISRQVWVISLDLLSSS